MKKILSLISLALIFVFCTGSVSAGSSSDSILSIMYHMISDTAPSGAFCITSEAFENDIKVLKESGYIFCTATELDKIVKEKRQGKYVAITFDDGYKSDIEKAVPILEKYNACATFFIVGSFVDLPGYVTRDDLKQMAKSPAVCIGNHTYGLHNLTRDELLAECLVSPDKVLADINKNSLFLEKIIQQKVTAFAFPYGVYKYYINDNLRKKGMITFSTSEKSVVNGDLIYGRFNRDINRSIVSIINSDNYAVVYGGRFQAYPSLLN